MFSYTVISACLLELVFALFTFESSQLHVVSAVEDEDPIVRTTFGLVRGTVMASRDNGSFYAFRGIPYAKPPIGDLRFKSPVSADSWEDVFNATRDGHTCAQNVTGTSEDCLVINVYSKKLPSTKGSNTTSLPVLVFIHGGGFSIGTAISSYYRPQKIMNREVVLVMFGYRLGPFGFLSTGDSAAYGNAGMLDQVLALTWVHDNIAAFGGDPQRVAVFGESAGAGSVGHLLLSPLTKGLFQAAIAQSGSSLGPWAIQKTPLKFANELGEMFNCSTENTSQLVECLRQPSTVEIVNAAEYLKDYDLLIIPFVPVVETSHSGSFLEEEPLKLLQEGRFMDVPVISGINKDEGVILYNQFIVDYNSTYDVIFQDNLEDVVGITLHDDRNMANVSAAVKDEYFSGIDFQNRSAAIRAAIDILSDCSIKAGNDMAVRLLAAGGVSVYMYEFAYAGSASTSNLTGEIEVNHADDLYYLFDILANMTESDVYISNTMIDMWINFADHHNPTPVGGDVEWTPSPNGTIRYLRIADNLTMEENYLTDRMHFWNDVVPSILRG